MRRKLETQPLAVQFLDLMLIQLANWRWSWRRMMITGMVAPLMSIAALGAFARDSGPTALAYILTGNVALALMFENMGKVTSHFAFMRVTGALYHFATLPVRRYTLILATVAAFFTLSLPALGVTVLFGGWYLGVRPAISPLLALVVPLAAVPLAGIGALIGSSARTPEEAGSVNLLAMLLMLALGPVMIPPERLPDWLVWAGYFSPATYAASALRQTLIGPVTARLWLDAAVLLGVTAIVFRLVKGKMNWRQE